MSTTTKSATARKVVGSLGVLGAAAAVAGMGTFGSFTDSTTPVGTNVATGILEIDLASVGTAIPVSTTGFVPGDSVTRAVNLSNKGTLPLAHVALNVADAAPSVLASDVTNGLQLTLKACGVA